MCQTNYSSRQLVKLNFCWQISQLLLEEKKKAFHHLKKKLKGLKKHPAKLFNLVCLVPNTSREQYMHTINKGLASDD